MHRGADLDAEAWRPDAVMERLKESAQALRALGLGSRDRPQRLAAKWPDIVRDSVEAYGYATPRVRLPSPDPAAISRADEAIGWLLWVGEDERRVLWGRACRIPWRALEDIDGRSHTTLRKFLASGLDTICARLNAAG